VSLLIYLMRLCILIMLFVRFDSWVLFRLISWLISILMLFSGLLFV